MTPTPPRTATELAARFRTVDRTFGPVPIWWWSGARLDRRRLRWQMEQLQAGGVHQAVVMALAPRGPLYGSLADDPPFQSEEWWSIFVGACEDAHDIGFRFWLYDQFGFSGANFQGQLVTARPEWAGQELDRVDRGQVRIRGFDYYDPDACVALIDTVLGEFQRRAGKWFGPVITGLFQDELPQLPTWGKTFAQTFAGAYGYDLTERLDALWEGADDAAAAVRRDYHAHRAALADTAFFRPYADWAAQAGLIAGFDQQTPAREGHPAGAIGLYGDYLATHSRFTAPGSDHWGDPKVHSSLAHANGAPRTWIEAFHSSGWGGTLEETYDWLGPFLRRGANLYDPHAVYYSTAGGWWEWAPPSTCWRQPYWPDYPVFAAAVSRLCALGAGGRLVADTVLVYPTTTVQADLTLSGPGTAALAATDVYNEINGQTCWFDERPGVLDRAGHDYEIFDEATLLRGEVRDDRWLVAGGEFRNIVLPAMSTVDDSFAGELARFAGAGGTVVCVGSQPERSLGGDGRGLGALQAAVAAGRIAVVPDPADLPAGLRRGPVSVEADCPFVLRRMGTTHVLTLVAHDERTGTSMPALPGATFVDRMAGTFRWETYWQAYSETGYDFTPVGDRVAHVRITGLDGHRAQRWDPRSGDRVALPVDPDGQLIVPFSDGPTAVVVLAAELPEPTRIEAGGAPAVTTVDGDWTLTAVSTLDNQWGDLADARRTGTLPIEVWRLEHQAGDDDWRPVLAGYGPFLRVRGPGDTAWRPYEYSLSRGIRKDPIHFASLGPKGTVPEEFLRWAGVTEGDRVAFAGAVDLPEGAGRTLVIGSSAERSVQLDGAPAAVAGSGYWTTTPVPDGARRLDLEVELVADATDRGEPGAEPELRATFAIVTDVERFRRPEWLRAADGGTAPGRVSFSTTADLASVPATATVQVGSEGPAHILVNGVEVGRQGAFEPYAQTRRPQVMPYDISSRLRPGPNEIAVVVDDPGGVAAVLVDGDLGLISGPQWTVTRDDVEVRLGLRRAQWLDPRWVCRYARPHPLPRAAWLDPAAASDGVVLDLVPDAATTAGGDRVERLRFTAPAGATELRVPTDVRYEASADGTDLAVDGPVVRSTAPLPAGTVVTLTFTARGGARAGGLLRGPIEAVTAPVRAPLTDWESLGLRALGGHVSYRIAVEVDPVRAGQTVVLDLGLVRGSAEVRLNDAAPASLVWSPYRADVTGSLRPGRNEVEIVVRGTLAGYLDDASPTPAVGRGQTQHGLFGPVRLLRYRSDPGNNPIDGRPR